LLEELKQKNFDLWKELKLIEEEFGIEITSFSYANKKKEKSSEN